MTAILLKIIIFTYQLLLVGHNLTRSETDHIWHIIK